MLKNILAEQRFPVARFCVHPVDRHTPAHHGKGVPGEIQVRHGIHQEGILLFAQSCQIRQAGAFKALQVALAHARFHLFHQFFYRERGKILFQQIVGTPVLDPRFAEIIPDKLAAHGFVRHRFSRQIRQIEHLHAALAQRIGKLIVFLLRQLQIGNVIKQKPLQIVRHQVFQLPSGSVQQHLAQRTDLACIVQG